LNSICTIDLIDIKKDPKTNSFLEIHYAIGGLYYVKATYKGKQEYLNLQIISPIGWQGG
jgi:hypothetical protein